MEVETMWAVPFPQVKADERQPATHDQEAQDDRGHDLEGAAIVVRLDLRMAHEVAGPDERPDHSRQHDSLDDQSLVDGRPVERIADSLQPAASRPGRVG